MQVSHQQVKLNIVSQFIQCNEEKNSTSKTSSGAIKSDIIIKNSITYETYKHLINQASRKSEVAIVGLIWALDIFVLKLIKNNVPICRVKISCKSACGKEEVVQLGDVSGEFDPHDDGKKVLL